MPRQNRVTPFGEIVAAPERGTLMGNRGILHDAAASDDPNAHIRRRWAGRAWISCRLEFRGRRDPVMAPGHYTRLFFLDEPTALAAGHRPCAFCRRADYLAFRTAWASGNANVGLGLTPLAPEIDRVLHGERLGPGGSKRTYTAPLAALPDGVFVTSPLSRSGGPWGDGLPRTSAQPMFAPRSGPMVGWEGVRGRGPFPLADAEPYLRWEGVLWRWTPAGYADRRPLPDGTVSVLTPPSIVAALAAGYQPFPPATPAVPRAIPLPRQMACPG